MLAAGLAGQPRSLDSASRAALRPPTITSNVRPRLSNRLLVRLAVSAAAALSVGSPAGAARSEPTKLLVRFNTHASDRANAVLLRNAGAEDLGEIPHIGVHILSVPAGEKLKALGIFKQDAQVDFAEDDAAATTADVTPNDPVDAGDWPNAIPQVARAWDNTTGSPLVVAVLDTGVNPVSDLGGAVLPGRDFAYNDSIPDDVNGHGTAVAGIIAARGNNGIGVAGLCWSCQILPVKVMNDSGMGSSSTIASGIVWAADQGAAIINMSLAGYSDSASEEAAVNYARSKGVVVVAAAGNNSNQVKTYPASIPGVISVAATDMNDQLYSFSTFGSWVTLAAPGCKRSVTRLDGAYDWFCGTSEASPFVAGTVALALSFHPGLSPDGVRDVLVQPAGAHTC